MLPADLTAALGALDGDARITILTGAGISAESGIPTFRGPEGYWTVGSDNYQPQEMGTQKMFQRMPREVWKWYLFRLGVCRQAAPNGGHEACAQLDAALGERFTLITQNVDGLHTRAGSSLERTYSIHGNLEQVRCGVDCCAELWPMPPDVVPVGRGEEITAAQWALLRCPRCGEGLRPHVLWFDESYDELWFRWDSSLSAAARTDLLIVVGTSGATTLPTYVVRSAARAGSLLIDVNPNANPFGELAERLPTGWALRGTSGELLPALAQILLH